MTFYHVDITHYVHFCPAQPEPHIWQTVRQVVDVIGGGPCRKPVNLYGNGTMTAVPCGQYRPAHQQCPACRVTIIERTVTIIGPGADQ